MIDPALESATLTPKLIVDSYRHAYRQVHERDPLIIHMFAEWYHVNGETVHRVALFHEITRLRGLAQQQQRQAQTVDRGLIQRLISRLRGM
jgi:hypothetical protein